MKMGGWGLLLCGAPVWLAACGGGFRLVGLTTDRFEYKPGAKVTLKLRNRSVRAVGYNLCNMQMQRRGASGWERVPWDEGEAVVCEAILLLLEPKSDETTRLTLEADLPEGEYRFVTNVEWNGASEEVTSDSFRVVRRASP